MQHLYFFVPQTLAQASTQHAAIANTLWCDCQRNTLRLPTKHVKSGNEAR